SRLWAVLALEGWVLRALGEEVAERCLQVAQRLLDRNRTDFVEPREFRLLLQLRQSSGSFVIPDSFLSLQPRLGAQPKHVVVGEARATERSGKDRLLLGSRIKPEPVGALDVQGSQLTAFVRDIMYFQPAVRPVGRAPFPGLNAEVSRSMR